jgi:predicted RNA-binding Zn-ribbon protein involved in translation (DUF1610 family)
MSYTPDTRQRLTASTRFFARLHSFDLECPHCGDVYVVRMGSTRKRSEKHPNWDPTTGRFTCTNKDCGRVYVLGILAWPIVKAPRVASATPEDQVPHPRQLAALRREGGGWWLPDSAGQRYARPSETNLTLEEERPDERDDTDPE